MCLDIQAYGEGLRDTFSGLNGHEVQSNKSRSSREGSHLEELVGVALMIK